MIVSTIFSRGGKTSPLKTIGLFRLRVFDYPALFDMICRNAGQALTVIFIRLLPAMQGGSTLNTIKCIKNILRMFSSIAKSQGRPGFVKYLKQVSVITQK
jgi:hypothetical protein